jgi:PPM family protein phosphatase
MVPESPHHRCLFFVDELSLISFVIRLDWCYRHCMLVVNAHGFTDVGRLRQHNEDGFGVWPTEGIFTVCDGMGGGSTGDVATKLVLEALQETSRSEFPPGDYRKNALLGTQYLEAAIQLANRRVLEKSRSSNFHVGIGAAVAAIFIENDVVFIAHVGDCRVYRYRAMELEPLTRDHSLLNDYRQYKPEATDEELAAVPRNVITRAIGFNHPIQIDHYHEHAHAGDLYLLCTDGIHGMLDDDAIAGILQTHVELPDKANALLDAALEAGGADNIAAVLVSLTAR